MSPEVEELLAEGRREAMEARREWRPVIGHGAVPRWDAPRGYELPLCSGEVEWRRIARAARNAREAQE